MVNRLITIALALGFTTSWAQPKELYVFKNEKRSHMAQAKKERQERREAALHQHYDLNVWTRTMTNQAKVDLNLKRDIDAELAICDMEGNTLEQIHSGRLKKGRHKFDYDSTVPQHRPLVCVLRVDGRLEAMKVVKFNAF